MRLDRFLTLRLFRPFGGSGSRAGAPRLPILMYHVVADDAEPGISPYYQVCTSPRRFADQMQWLAEDGWQGVTLAEGLDFLAGRGNRSGRRPVAITFDDGFRDFHAVAAPILQRCGFVATMYLPSGFIGERRLQFKSRDCLTWGEVRELRRQGHEFGSHTVTHPVLRDLSWPEIERELAQSKRQIEQELGEEIGSFAYPYAFPQEDGAFADEFAALLRRQSYRNGVTTVVGRAQPGDDPFRLKRLPVNQSDDRALFAAKLAGAYDWFAGPQKWHRAIRRSLHPAPSPAHSSP